MLVLTGASGFIGRAIAAALRERQPPDLAMILTGRRPSTDAQYVSMDLGDANALDAIDWPSVRTLIHCAGAPGRGDQDFAAKNVETTRNVLQLIAPGQLSALVLISSTRVYGWPPGAESLQLDEEWPRRSETGYGRSKLAQEDLCREHADGGPLTILRPGPVYGPGMAPENLLPSLVRRCQQDEPLEIFAPRTHTENYLHVDDLTLVAARAALESVSGTFNVCSDDTLDIFELAELVKRTTGGQGPIVDRATDAPYPRLSFPNGKVKRAFGLSFRRLADHIHELAE